jgi:hypothetical protein
MKHLLRVLFVLALLCGGSSFAHASGIDFRLTNLDPPAVDVCNPPGVPQGSPGSTNCTIFTGGSVSPVNLSQAACTGAGIGAGLTSGTYGCFVLDNESGFTINSDILSFLIAPLVTTPSCDSAGQDGIASALDVVSCGVDPSNPLAYLLDFAGGPGVAPGGALIVFEEGENPNDFQGGSAIIGLSGVTPEPDSLLLFSTGVMMAGLYMSRRIWTTSRKSN